MIDHMLAALQVRRLAGLEYFQTLPSEALDELVAVVGAAETENVAGLAVAAWIRDHTKRPTPVELRVLVERFNCEHLDAIQYHHANCFKCCDVGLVVVDGKVAACECEIGRRPFVLDWVGRAA